MWRDVTAITTLRIWAGRVGKPRRLNCASLTFARLATARANNRWQI
jgi:hypothetical protein